MMSKWYFHLLKKQREEKRIADAIGIPVKTAKKRGLLPC